MIAFTVRLFGQTDKKRLTMSSFVCLFFVFFVKKSVYPVFDVSFYTCRTGSVRASSVLIWPRQLGDRRVCLK